MKKIIFLFCIVFLSCSQRYIAKESWIDTKDVEELSKNKDASYLEKLPFPVIAEINNDTIIYTYNFHPLLYKTYNINKGYRFKPEQKDITKLWGNRDELIDIFILDNRILKIDKNLKYKLNEESSKVKISKQPKKYIDLSTGVMLSSPSVSCWNVGIGINISNNNYGINTLFGDELIGVGFQYLRDKKFIDNKFKIGIKFGSSIGVWHQKIYNYYSEDYYYFLVPKINLYAGVGRFALGTNFEVFIGNDMNFNWGLINLHFKF